MRKLRAKDMVVDVRDLSEIVVCVHVRSTGSTVLQVRRINPLSQRAHQEIDLLAGHVLLNNCRLDLLLVLVPKRTEYY
eukprot:COSAG05_NODE_63_length_22889_cov_41.986617_11_plen_78_part_00